MLSKAISYHYLKSIICFLLILLCSYNSQAQIDSLIKAQDLCKEKHYEKAIVLLENVIVHPETKNDPASWHIRAFAYVNQVKLLGQKDKDYLNFLEISINSAIESIKLDSKSEYLEPNQKIVDNGAKLYRNLANSLIKASLDLDNYSKTEFYYSNYKKYRKQANPNYNFNNDDIEYYNVIGSHFAGLFSNDTTENKIKYNYLDVAKEALLRVLSIDPKNIPANTAIGILYYNQGATLYRSLDYGADFTEADFVQENAIKLLRKSLPHMEIAYAAEPTSEKILIAFEGIYYGLLMPEISDEFKQKREALKKQHK